MTTIILVRHGETEWNVNEVFRGRADIELNRMGVKQAELLAQYLGKRQIEAVYSSPLKRALKTAEAIACSHHLNAEIALGLNDIDFGKWQGVPHEETKTRYKDLYSRWLHHPQDVTMPDGESLDSVRERAMQVVNKAIAKHEGTVALVAHRVVNKVLICAMLGLDNSHFWKIRQDTCGISTFFHEDGHFILNEHNNTSFLKSLHQTPLCDF